MEITCENFMSQMEIRFNSKNFLTNFLKQVVYWRCDCVYNQPQEANQNNRNKRDKHKHNCKGQNLKGQSYSYPAKVDQLVLLLGLD